MQIQFISLIVGIRNAIHRPRARFLTRCALENPAARRFTFSVGQRFAAAVAILLVGTAVASADSVNSPNITMNVDANRAAGNGAGGVAVVVNTVTIAETMLTEYSAGSGKAIVIQVRPGFQFDPASAISAQSATIGLNGESINTAASITPDGSAGEAIMFNLTSGTSAAQDIVRISGIRLLIRSAAGAAGPAQTTLSITTTSAGGAFSNQGIVAASLTKGVADHLEFSAQPGSTQSNGDLLPAVKIVDFGGNVIDNDVRTITLQIQDNPSAGTLTGINAQQTGNGVATWSDVDNLHIASAGSGYTLRASHDGADLQSSDVVISEPFDITAGAPDHLVISTQPVDTAAGAAILVEVTVKDQSGNTVTGSTDSVTLDSAVNTGGWPLLVDTSLTKPAQNGVAAWDESDNLRINKAVADYALLASGVGAPVQSDFFDVIPAAPSALRFVQQPSDVQEDISIAPAVTVEIIDEFANRADSTADVSLNLQSGCGGAMTGESAAAADGLATFDAVRIDTPCTSVVLEASSGNLPRTVSDPFDVTALPPVALRFVQQPTGAVERTALNPPVSVEVIDASGKRTNSTATIELTLLSSCGGALSVSSAAAVGGLATFAILSIDKPCTAIMLQATSDGLTGTTSAAFDVAAAANNDNAMDNENANDNAGGENPNPTCGACGQGSALAMMPLLLWLVGMKTIARRRGH